MTIDVTPHLNFRGQAREALEFYQQVFGGDLAVVTYADAGQDTDAPGSPEIMWGQVSSSAGFRVMAYDVPTGTDWDTGQNAFFVSVRGNDVDEITGFWSALRQGATIRVPLGASQWSPAYGMLTDSFGVTWVLDVESQ